MRGLTVQIIVALCYLMRSNLALATEELGNDHHKGNPAHDSKRLSGGDQVRSMRDHQQVGTESDNHDGSNRNLQAISGKSGQSNGQVNDTGKVQFMVVFVIGTEKDAGTKSPLYMTLIDQFGIESSTMKFVGKTGFLRGSSEAFAFELPAGFGLIKLIKLDLDPKINNSPDTCKLDNVVFINKRTKHMQMQHVDSYISSTQENVFSLGPSLPIADSDQQPVELMAEGNFAVTELNHKVNHDVRLVKLAKKQKETKRRKDGRLYIVTFETGTAFGGGLQNPIYFLVFNDKGGESRTARFTSKTGFFPGSKNTFQFIVPRAFGVIKGFKLSVDGSGKKDNWMLRSVDIMNLKSNRRQHLLVNQYVTKAPASFLLSSSENDVTVPSKQATNKHLTVSFTTGKKAGSGGHFAVQLMLTDENGREVQLPIINPTGGFSAGSTITIPFQVPDNLKKIQQLSLKINGKNVEWNLERIVITTELTHHNQIIRINKILDSAIEHVFKTVQTKLERRDDNNHTITFTTTDHSRFTGSGSIQIYDAAGHVSKLINFSKEGGFLSDHSQTFPFQVPTNFGRISLLKIVISNKGASKNLNKLSSIRLVNWPSRTTQTISIDQVLVPLKLYIFSVPAEIQGNMCNTDIANPDGDVYRVWLTAGDNEDAGTTSVIRLTVFDGHNLSVSVVMPGIGKSQSREFDVKVPSEFTTISRIKIDMRGSDNFRLKSIKIVNKKSGHTQYQLLDANILLRGNNSLNINLPNCESQRIIHTTTVPIRTTDTLAMQRSTPLSLNPRTLKTTKSVDIIIPTTPTYPVRQSTTPTPPTHQTIVPHTSRIEMATTKFSAPLATTTPKPQRNAPIKPQPPRPIPLSNDPKLPTDTCNKHAKKENGRRYLVSIITGNQIRNETRATVFYLSLFDVNGKQKTYRLYKIFREFHSYTYDIKVPEGFGKIVKFKIRVENNALTSWNLQAIRFVNIQSGFEQFKIFNQDINSQDHKDYTFSIDNYTCMSTLEYLKNQPATTKTELGGKSKNDCNTNIKRKNGRRYTVSITIKNGMTNEVKPSKVHLTLYDNRNKKRRFNLFRLFRRHHPYSYGIKVPKHFGEIVKFKITIDKTLPGPWTLQTIRFVNLKSGFEQFKIINQDINPAVRHAYTFSIPHSTCMPKNPTTPPLPTSSTGTPSAINQPVNHQSADINQPTTPPARLVRRDEDDDVTYEAKFMNSQNPRGHHARFEGNIHLVLYNKKNESRSFNFDTTSIPFHMNILVPPSYGPIVNASVDAKSINKDESSPIDKLILVNQERKTKQTFDFNKSGNRKPVSSPTKYQVHVVTANETGAGTNDSIFLTVYGDNTVIKRKELSIEGGFQPGSDVSFDLETPANFGRIHNVLLEQNDETGFKLDSIQFVDVNHNLVRIFKNNKGKFLPDTKGSDTAAANE